MRGGWIVAVLGLLVLPGPASAQYSDPVPPPTKTVTLSANHVDVFYGERVTFTGRVDPPPGRDEDQTVTIGSIVPGIPYSDRPVGSPAKVAADGTFSVRYKPESNRRYTAVYRQGSKNVFSAPLVVYTDLLLKVYWRRLRGSRIEMAMLGPPALIVDYWNHDTVHFYGFRRGQRRARRIARTRIYYTDEESSEGRVAAYAKRRVHRAKRIQYVFACRHERRPDIWGRPDDPVSKRCGRRYLLLP